MNKLFILLVFSVGINATAQVATSGTTNSGTNASAIGYQSSATNTVSTAIGRETLASGITPQQWVIKPLQQIPPLLQWEIVVQQVE